MPDVTSSISNLIPNLSLAGVLNFALIILIGILIAGGGSYLIWYILKKKKYGQYKIVILEKDSTGNTHEYYDRGGISLDKKTGFKLLFLEKMKKGLNPNNVPYVTSKDKKGRLVKTVYLRKIGVSNYIYIHIKLDDNTKFTAGEEDLNWLAQDAETMRRTFNKEGWLTKYAPYIFFAITMIICMILLISLFNKFPIIEKTSENLDKVAARLETISGQQYNMTHSTPINGQPIIVPGRGG